MKTLRDLTYHVMPLVLLVLTTMFACSKHNDFAASLDSIEEQLLDGDARQARAGAQRLLDDTLQMDAAQLARLSVVFMQLSDAATPADADDQAMDDVRHAVQCCRRALDVDESAAIQYYTSAPATADPHVMALTLIVSNLEIPDSLQTEGFNFDEQYADSLMAEGLSPDAAVAK